MVGSLYFVLDIVVSSTTVLANCKVYRASGRSRKKKSNFAGFSGTNSRKKWPISREFLRPVSLKNDW